MLWNISISANGISAVVRHDGVAVVLQIMTTHQSSDEIQQNSLGVLRNISDSRDGQAPLLLRLVTSGSSSGSLTSSSQSSSSAPWGMVNGWPAWHACVPSSVALSYTECAVAMSASVSLGKSSLTWEAGVQLYYVLYVLYFIVYYIILCIVRP